MCAMLQLSPPIPVRTPLGEGWALIVIDYGPQWNTCWAVQLHETGELKHFDSNQIRFPKNFTYDTPRSPGKWRLDAERRGGEHDDGARVMRGERNEAR